MINPVKRTINESLILRAQLIYNGRPWFGKSIMAIIDQAEHELPERALAIINHMIAWRNFVSEALAGNDPKIELNTNEDWPPVTKSQDEILDNLEKSQLRLIKTIRAFDVRQWRDMPKDAEYTNLQLCHGLLDHDIYHLGQVALVIKQHSD